MFLIERDRTDRWDKCVHGSWSVLLFVQNVISTEMAVVVLQCAIPPGLDVHSGRLVEKLLAPGEAKHELAPYRQRNGRTVNWNGARHGNVM